MYPKRHAPAVFPSVIVDVPFINRQVHPLQEGFDVVFSVLPKRLPGAVEEKIGLFEQNIVRGNAEAQGSSLTRLSDQTSTPVVWHERMKSTPTNPRKANVAGTRMS
ncbi:hypothetical protein [Paraburkholderia phytofirmans]|uniref:Uncharacterized protein n=1 Tax=Paraburkholderia phytofirmans OLGA172 TaxID=1417228 RepID=A0A167VUF5_9BURK|nr:hypothetical protein [Paraburkholderia phytofirmans]ANB71773.1 hypothetical protein AYM40_04830 [Paraburkholderia phytofirmans OLGA172]